MPEPVERNLGLDLVRVTETMLPLPANFSANGAPTIGAGEDLKTALSKLLQSGAPILVVEDAGKPVGVLSLEQIRSSVEHKN